MENELKTTPTNEGAEDKANPELPTATPEATPEANPEVTFHESAAQKVAEYFEKSPTVTNLEKRFRGQALNDIQDLLSKMRVELIKLV